MRRGYGQTTALKLKAIASAIEALGSEVMFKDHYPQSIFLARFNARDIKMMCDKLGLKIEVRSIDNRVYLKSRWFGVEYPPPAMVQRNKAIRQ